ncbi:MAG TPA: transcriptional repressor [Rhodanobacteraceae bacterium]|jgi:Fur family zinc uptake transcriptional regulator|nr:transcriptional repressor [Rhodanobacteraceae bacterium]
MVTASKHAHHHHHDAAGIVREVEHECTTRGLRLTPLRREVLDLVANARKPVKAYDLLESLRDSHAGAAPPTVYRALDFLLENGFIHKLESINSFVFCQHPADSHQVPFLICDVCESATEVCDDGAIAHMIAQQAKGFGFRAKAQILEVHGICKGCGHA